MKGQAGNAHVYYQSIDERRIAVVQVFCNALMMFPQLRLGQLLFNALDCYGPTKGKDIFYVSDVDVVLALRSYMENYRNPTEEELSTEAPENPDLVPDKTYAENQEGFRERCRTFSLNSIDWQLYSSKPKDELKECVRTLNAALRETVEKYPPSDWREARDAMFKLMDQYRELGARDTEPEVAVCEFLEFHLDVRVERWA